MHFASDTGHDNQENIFPGTEGQKVTELRKPDFLFFFFENLTFDQLCFQERSWSKGVNMKINKGKPH